MKNISVIIPSLDPDKRLEGVVTGLKELGFDDIILVDDGSKPENKKYFPVGDGITLLVHEVNKGKGAALKTALKYISENRPDSVGAVSCDGDGQHLGKDIKAVAEKMLETGCFVLGVRDFSQDNVPFKSRIGNRISSVALALISGVKTCDTQTGLRGIPSPFYREMINVSGNRFEYETNVLLELKGMKCPYCEVEIDTVYLDENKSSHYRPFMDSVRIFSVLLKYIFSSLVSFLADIGIFALLYSLIRLSEIPSTVIARIISSVLNFTLNKKVVFKSGQPVCKTLWKYYLIAIPTMLISAFGLKYIAAFLGITEGSIAVTLLKIVIDTVLFFANYGIQKKWIFKK